MKEGKDFLPKKVTSKILRVFGPYQNKPFRAPHTRKEPPTGNAPMGAIPHKAVTSHFFQQGKTELQRLQWLFFDPTTGEEGVDPLSQ